MRGWTGEDILVVSIGTGSETESYDFTEAQNWGKVEWIQPLIHMVFDGVSDAVDYQMQQMLGKRFVRLQVPLQYAQADLGNATPENLQRLTQDARRLIEALGVEIDDVCRLLAAKADTVPAITVSA